MIRAMPSARRTPWPCSSAAETCTSRALGAVPSLNYLQAVPPFAEHFFESEDDADESIDNGLDRRPDLGRARRPAAGNRPRFRCLSDFEMGNKDDAEVVRRLLAAGYGKAIAAIAGPDRQADPPTVYSTALKAIEVFEQDYRTFYPYSSKFDAVLAGQATLNAQEARGRDLFEAPDKGNCASCHVSQRGNDGTPPQFTDYGLIAPRRAAQSRHSRQQRSALFRSRPVRLARADFGAQGGVLRSFSHADRCAMSRCVRPSSHNGSFPPLRQGCESFMWNGKQIRGIGMRIAPTAASTNTTTCRRRPRRTSTWTRLSIAIPATNRRLAPRRSMMWSHS